jgi:ketosteroid isomerase-like protein
MKTSAPCPSNFAIERFLLGELPEGAPEVADHIAACVACRALVATKRADDAVFIRSPEAEGVRRVLSERRLPQALAPNAERRTHGAFVRRSALAGMAVVAALAIGVVVSRHHSPSAPTSLAGTNDEEVVKRVQREWMEAIRDKDAATLDRILADDYVYTDSSGRVTNKADSLRQARSTGGRMKAFQTSDEKTLIYGDMAIITGRLRVEGVAGGEPYDTEVRFTDILARIDGQWRAVAAHASKR